MTSIFLFFDERLFGPGHEQTCLRGFASAQSDQHLCYLLIGGFHIKTCFKLKFTILPVSVAEQADFGMT